MLKKNNKQMNLLRFLSTLVPQDISWFNNNKSRTQFVREQGWLETGYQKDVFKG